MVADDVERIVVRYDEDSPGEIYLDNSSHHGPVTLEEEEDSGLYVLENGTEFSLTPLVKRKSAFETERKYAKYDRRGRQRHFHSSTNGEMGEGLGVTFHRVSGSIKSPIQVEIVDKPVNYVKSANIPYIEEEKSLLNSINVVETVKRKFLQS